MSGFRPSASASAVSSCEIDADDFSGDVVLRPAFFDKGDKKGAGFFKGTQSLRGQAAV